MNANHGSDFGLENAEQEGQFKICRKKDWTGLTCLLVQLSLECLQIS